MPVRVGGLTSGAPFSAWHVNGPRQRCAEILERRDRALRRGYGRRDGTATALPRPRRLLPRRRQREQRRADLLRRGRPDRLRPDPGTCPASVRLAAPRPLPHGQPLPPARRDSGAEPLRRHARPQRPVRPRIQRAARPQAPCLRPALLVEGDRIRGAVRLHARVHRPEPRSPRLCAAAPGMALDVGAGGRSDRFAWCRTTPTS